MKETMSLVADDAAELWLRLEELKCTVDDVRSVRLVLSNLARHHNDRALEQLAEGLGGVHSRLDGQFSEAVRAVRQCMSYDENRQVRRPSLRLVRE